VAKKESSLEQDAVSLSVSETKADLRSEPLTSNDWLTMRRSAFADTPREACAWLSHESRGAGLGLTVLDPYALVDRRCRRNGRSTNDMTPPNSGQFR